VIHTFQIEPQRLSFFQRAFLNRKLVQVREGIGLVRCCGIKIENDKTFFTVTLRTPDPTVLISPVLGVRGHRVIHIKPEVPKEPSEEGMKRWHGGRSRDGLVCTCVYDCERPCKGECGCEACLDAYGAFLEMYSSQKTA
jgi:hypothetical protein